MAENEQLIISVLKLCGHKIMIKIYSEIRILMKKIFSDLTKRRFFDKHLSNLNKNQ